MINFILMKIQAIGSFIAKRRTALMVKQRELAKLCGVSEHALCNLEQGTGNPTLKAVSAVAEALGLELRLDVMDMEAQLLTYALGVVKEKYGDQIAEAFGLEVIVPTLPFPTVKLADLYAALEAEFGYKVPDSEKGDLTTEAEQLSYQWVKKHYNHEFLFITDYSAEKRAFYHMRDENGIPQGYDLIWRGVEITTGAQREHRYDILKKQAQEKGLDEDVKFYLEFFKYGCPPHGGFGLGVDRLTMLLCNLHINEAMFLFRSPKRLTP